MHEIYRVWEIKENKLTSSQLIHQDLITFNFQIITIITIFWIISFIYEIYSRKNLFRDKIIRENLTHTFTFSQWKFYSIKYKIRMKKTRSLSPFPLFSFIVLKSTYLGILSLFANCKTNWSLEPRIGCTYQWNSLFLKLRHFCSN